MRMVRLLMAWCPFIKKSTIAINMRRSTPLGGTNAESGGHSIVERWVSLLWNNHIVRRDVHPIERIESKLDRHKNKQKCE